MRNYVLIGLSMAVLGCTNNDKNAGGTSGNDTVQVPAAQTQEVYLESIQNMEARLKSDQSGFNYATAETAVNMYKDFVALSPDHERAPEFLFKTAQIQEKMGKDSAAIASLQKVIDNYPKFENVGFCYFLQGFIYQDKLGDEVNAKQRYEATIQKFPGTEAAKNANASLKTLGKSDEELLKMIRNSEKKAS